VFAAYRPDGPKAGMAIRVALAWWAFGNYGWPWNRLTSYTGNPHLAEA